LKYHRCEDRATVAATTERGTLVQNGLFFFMWLGAGLLGALILGTAIAVFTDLKEKLGRR
jgi:hypothetical protein